MWCGDGTCASGTGWTRFVVFVPFGVGEAGLGEHAEDGEGVELAIGEREEVAP
jgi:hypothetical protein